jgi:hypothetical protein
MAGVEGLGEELPADPPVAAMIVSFICVLQ